MDQRQTARQSCCLTVKLPCTLADRQVFCWTALLFAFHPVRLSAHYTLSIIHCPLFIIHYSLSIIHYQLFIIHCSLSIVHSIHLQLIKIKITMKKLYFLVILLALCLGAFSQSSVNSSGGDFSGTNCNVS